MQPVVRSQHLSWFRRQQAAYLYHDLFGYLLEMSADLKAFVDFFAEPKTAEDAAAHFAAQWSRDQVGQFFGVFWQQKILVAPGVQELDALCDAVPIKGPWILAVSEPRQNVRCVFSRGFGHEPWAQPQMLELDEWQSDLWRAIDGEKTVRELAATLSEAYDGDPAMDLGRAAVSVAQWTHSARQLTRTLPAPKSKLPKLPPYATSTVPYAPFDAPDPPADARRQDLLAYHQHEIADAERQFEENETTLSHLLSDPHPALQDRTYAQTLAQIALERGWVAQGRATLAEVGGGTGRFAEQFFAAVHAQLPAATLTVVDASPALHAAQAARLQGLAPAVRTVLGNAAELHWPNASLDFVVSNEVIADLPIGFVTRSSVALRRADGQTDEAALAHLLHYDLPLTGAPEPVPVQLGAGLFLEQIARALKPGGWALLTEFGEKDQFPVESTHLDHAEWSVHFGHLLHVAAKLGLRAELVAVPDLIGLRQDVWVLAANRTQFRNLRFLLRSIGCDLPKRALTPEQLAQHCGGKLRPERLEGLQFRPIGERVMGIAPKEFKALVLHKPAEEA